MRVIIDCIRWSHAGFELDGRGGHSPGQPVRTLHGGLNREYFRGQRGVTCYNFIRNQFSGFHSIVIPGTLGESPCLLHALLEHHTELQPEQIITDAAGYSNVIFRLFCLLGFQFSPRLADLGDARYWRIDKKCPLWRAQRSRAALPSMGVDHGEPG